MLIEAYKVINCTDNADNKGITISNIIANCDNGKLNNFTRPAFLLKLNKLKPYHYFYIYINIRQLIFKLIIEHKYESQTVLIMQSFLEEVCFFILLSIIPLSILCKALHKEMFFSYSCLCEYA